MKNLLLTILLLAGAGCAEENYYNYDNTPEYYLVDCQCEVNTVDKTASYTISYVYRGEHVDIKYDYSSIYEGWTWGIGIQDCAIEKGRGIYSGETILSSFSIGSVPIYTPIGITDFWQFKTDIEMLDEDPNLPMACNLEIIPEIK